MNANEWLQHAAGLIWQRGKERDRPGGERSFKRAALIYSAVADQDFYQDDVPLVLMAVKLARLSEKVDADSLADLIAYAALYAEATGVELPDQPEEIQHFAKKWPECEIAHLFRDPLPFKIGDRVTRGPNWKWGDQGGADPKGTVIGSDRARDGWAMVSWDNGEVESYPVADENHKRNHIVHLREAKAEERHGGQE